MRLFLFAALASLMAVSAQAAAPAKPAAAKTGPFDVRDPTALVTLLTTMGAKASIARTEGTEVFVKVETPGGGFGAQYVDCDATGKACKALAFSTAFDRKGATFAQVNGFNQAEIACRAFISADGKPNVMYSTLVNLRMTTEEVKQHIGVWQGCLGSFSAFTNDPVGFLAKAN